MVKVLVVGATGYIGGGVARAFRRAGYQVYGTTRNTNFINLIKDEIIPVLGDTEHPEKLKSVIEQCSVIVDAVGYAPDSPHGRKFFDYVSEVKKTSVSNFKTTYMFTSGIMIYASGDRVDFPLDESFNPKPKDPVEMIPKKAIEDHILNNTELLPVVVRPGFVYGGHGGVIASLFFDIKPDDPELITWGSLTKKWSWVHLDDLGDAYVKIAEKGSLVSNQVFNVASLGDNPTFIDLKYECAKAAGWKGTKDKLKSVPISNPRMANWEWDVVINPTKAVTLLGWTPRHIGFLNEVGLYYQSWKAAKG